ncbi:TlpA family protein disulfide reductase [Stieleria varia]|uniref:Thiol-disulfide oxidoreductase ResA n=1 Tax=Stieleria varia TaxID=2528005 RepID=A0A5C6B220_9BACT|nr:TlpA disulfide reductase family protein [Stieleria varia]TWU04444.1 Thiol-disulfide oxidoreductase ResA [Stieleria varia]
MRTQNSEPTGCQIHRFRFTAGLLGIICAIGFGSLGWHAAMPPRALADDVSDAAAFQQIYNELLSRMDKDVDDAAAYLEAKLAEHPEMSDLNILRESLAGRFASDGQDEKAWQQFQMLLDDQIAHVNVQGNQYGIWMTIQGMQGLNRQSPEKDKMMQATQRGVNALSSVSPELEMQAQLPLSLLTAMHAKALSDDGKEEEAKKMVQARLDRLREINTSDDATEQTMQAIVRLLRTLSTDQAENDPWRDDCIAMIDGVLESALERFPESPALQSDYAETQYLMITRWKQDDPDAAKARLDRVTKRLLPISGSNRNVQSTLRRLEIHRERIAGVKPAKTLVGAAAPDWDIDAWVNATDVSRESLKGKVILIDFWAMWCGPCIATFDHLREWRKEFGDDGFEIVGVTTYYNYAWDDLNQRASRSTDEVSAEDERKTLESFLKHHELLHPVIVTPKESEMQSEYGVRGIPHVVLIDREGVVQLVQTGAGEATAKTIEAKIRELLGKGKGK